MLIEKMVTLTPELVEALNRVRGERPFSPFLEELLWNVGEVHRAANRARICRQPRPQVGRYPRRKKDSPHVNDDPTTRRSRDAS